MFHVTSAYPGDAIGGADFFSKAAQRKVVDTGPDGSEVVRDELVVVFDRDFQPDDIFLGRLCISEQTIRALGTLVGLLDPQSARRQASENLRLRNECDALSARAIAAEEALASLKATGTTRFIALDGSVHASQEAAQRHMNPEPAALTRAAPLPEAP